MGERPRAVADGRRRVTKVAQVQRSAEVKLGLAEFRHPHRAPIEGDAVIAVVEQIVGVGTEYPALQQQRLALVLCRPADAALEAEGLRKSRALHRDRKSVV